MPNLATWLRAKDEKWFHPIFARYPHVKIWNALTSDVPLEQMDGLLLTGGPDIAPEFLDKQCPIRPFSTKIRIRNATRGNSAQSNIALGASCRCLPSAKGCKP